MAKGGMLTLQFVSAHSSSNSNKIKFDLSLQYTETYLRDFVVKSFQCLYRPQGKVIFYTCLSVHRRGHAWWGACVAGGACVVGCVHGRGACVARGAGMARERGHAWWETCMGVYVARGAMHGRGHAWWRGACVAGETATVVDGMHPTGMHSCLKYFNSHRNLSKTHPRPL